MKLSSREVKILFISISIITIVIIYLLVIDPLMMHWQNISQKIEVAKARLHKSIVLMQAKKGIDEEYKLYAKKLQSTGSNEQEMARMLNELEKTASESGVKILSIRPRPVEEKDYHRYFEVEIDTESQMGYLMRFIYYLKNSPQLLKVGRISLSAGGSRDTSAVRAVLAVSKIALD
jgi:Tfp pilus assembly protein PilO